MTALLAWHAHQKADRLDSCFCATEWHGGRIWAALSE